MTPTTDRQKMPSNNQPPNRAFWHCLAAPEVMERLSTSTSGLSESQANLRRGQYGPNLVVRGRQTSALTLFLRQMNNPLVLVLLGSGALAIFMGRGFDGLTVLAVVVLNALIGFIQEYRAGNAIAALSQLMPEVATVVRGSSRIALVASDLVPGDIVTLQSGDKVPADVRLIECRGLFVNESALTGESLPVQKIVESLPKDLSLGDRVNMAYNGTFVTSGTGIGVVVETGMQTELGRISSMISSATAMQTPLTRKMEKVAKSLTVVVVSIGLLLFVVGLLRGYPLVDAALASITMAVAAIPEGLPAIITIAMAIGVHRMACRRAIIRHLPAVETLGSTTVICSDKTGTLTKNEMTVQALWTPSEGVLQVTGIGYEPTGRFLRKGTSLNNRSQEVIDLLLGGILCNDATMVCMNNSWSASGDPTEASMVTAALKYGLSPDESRREWNRVDAIPFESDRQFMATLNYGSDGNVRVFLKGATETVLMRCTANTPEVRRAAETQMVAIAGSGMRVLAIASKSLTSHEGPLTDADVTDGFTLLGLQGMIDPPRQEAAEAVISCRQAGIAVKMITGDHPQTATAIGEQLGLVGEQAAMTGDRLATLSDQELDAIVDSVGVYARVAPEHKLRLVKALQKRGHVVAMTGDGVNDAPALKQADIGVAMGISGTAVSKEASDMVLADDNFASIAAAVQEGRRVYDNLVKALSFVLPTNLGEGLIVLLAVAFFPVVNGVPLMPILPVQILWVNLVAAVGLALPLAFEAKESDIMLRPPRQPETPILSTFVLLRTAIVALLMTAGSLGLFLYEFYLEPNQGDTSDLVLRQAQTMAITTLVLFQVFYLFLCRSLQDSVFSIGFFTNKTVFLGAIGILLLQALFVNLPVMNSLFGSAPLPLKEWLEATVVAMSVIPAVALEKWLWRRARTVAGNRKTTSITA